MRTLFAALICLVLLAPIASAQSSIDPSEVKFLMQKCKDWQNTNVKGKTRIVNGIVSNMSYLNHPDTSWQLIQMGVAFAQQQCPAQERPMADIGVHLRPGDPSTFTDATRGFEWSEGSLNNYPEDAVYAAWDGVEKRLYYYNHLSNSPQTPSSIKASWSQSIAVLSR